MYNFFISYSRNADKETIEQYIAILEYYGFKVWYDKVDVVLSKNINSELYNTLSLCKMWDGMILFLDKTYFRKEWCLKELEYALNNNIIIYPILLNITKKDIPQKYKELNELNLCTIKSSDDINYAIYKTLTLFLNTKTNTIVKTRNSFQNNILKHLILDFENKNQQTNEIIFVCDNIALCLKYLILDKYKALDENTKILYNIIHLMTKCYYLQENISRFQIRIVVSATKLLIRLNC